MKAHDALLQQPDYQFSFPGFAQPKTPEWLLALGRFLRAHQTAIEWVFWIVAGAIMLAALFVLARQYLPLLRTWRPKPKSAAVAPAAMAGWRPTAAQARRLLGDADALAAQGLYADAVHLILLRSIDDIDERRPNVVRRAYTSREIERLGALPDAARTAFGEIARVVEGTLFAGKDVGAADFARCRSDYEAFAFAPAWQVAR